MRPFALAALAGVLYFTSFAGIDVWPLSFVCLIPLFVVLDGKALSGKRACCIGLLFGSVTNWGGYYWLIGMLEDFSGFPLPACIFFALVICFYQGGQLGLFFWLLWRIRRQGWSPLYAAPLLYTATEQAYPLLFPSYFANCLHQLPLPLQIADLGGPSLVSLWMVAVNCAVYAAYLEIRGRASGGRPLMYATVAATLLTLGYGAYRIDQVDTATAAAPKLKVGLVQTNMGIFQKRKNPGEGYRRHIEQSLALERAEGPDLLVWPESAVGRSIPGNMKNIRGLLGPLTTPLLFGGLSRRTEDGQSRLYNTAFLIDADGDIKATVDKTYLLAFGEYLPFGETFPILYDWSPKSGRFSAGTHTRPMVFGDYRITSLICYEDVLPGFTRRAVIEGDPHLLVNITNDSWFGDTTEPWIHLALAKLRAIEHHRFLVRSTNSGVSAVVDPVGRVVTHSGVFERASLSAEVAMLEGSTPYRTLGDWPGWLGIVVSLVLVVRKRR